MAGKLRVDGMTIEPGGIYSGKQVIHLCSVSFENGVRAAKRIQGNTEQALQRAYDRGYADGKRDRSNEITGVLEALKVLKEYFQDTID